MQTAGEMFLNHISQQMLLNGQGNNQKASDGAMGTNNGGFGVPNQHMSQEEQKSLGSGLGGLFGASGGGYNFDLSGNGNGLHSMSGMHVSSVTEIESKMMNNQQVESAIMNSGSSRTTSRFSFANRNSAEGGQKKGDTTSSIPVPPGFSA